MSARKKYTVGWICAVTTEYRAAIAFLDGEPHQPPDSLPIHDTNHYTLGRMGPHNVVIGCLPSGGYGISAATVAARDMIHSFPSVKICLLVGIGGGVPGGKHDVRLGDVVVSLRDKSTDAVLQYDFGKTIQGEGLQLTGALDQPPLVLKTAIQGLKARHQPESNWLAEHVNSVLDNNEGLSSYRQPDESLDRLHRADVDHKESCKRGCGAPANLVVRGRRQRGINPAIHYGPIASANQVMKDAFERDELGRKYGVLCFEMEAAGVINHFPCLVIRGICDYSDSHKNDEWQDYAALTAAAYAKALLKEMIPRQLAEAADLTGIMAETKSRLDSIEKKNEQRSAADEFVKVRTWLSASYPSTNYHLAQEKRHERSGRWFLDSDHYKEWKSPRPAFLWLHGMSGCGKTVLSSSIINDLEASAIPVLYFYFDGTDNSKQSLNDLIRSLIDQLYITQTACQNTLNSVFYHACKQGNIPPSRSQLLNCFREMTRELKTIWIVLDGLDECAPNDRRGLLSWMESMHALKHATVHLLATSIWSLEIQAQLLAWTHPDERLELSKNHIAVDINAYVKSRIMQETRWQHDPAYQKSLIAGISMKADGMFRLAACWLDNVSTCFSAPEVEGTLASLPATLSEQYSRIIQGIPATQRERASLILQLLVHGKRPLSVEEVADALCVDTKKEPAFEIRNRMPMCEEVARYCGSLVVLVPINDCTGNKLELHLAHLSVKEYLLSEELCSPLKEYMVQSTASATITRLCLAYLSSVFKPYNHFTYTPLEYDAGFTPYAVLYWPQHARLCECDNETTQRILKFFRRRELYQPWAWRFQAVHWQSYHDRPLSETKAPLYYASLAGLLSVVKALLVFDSIHIDGYDALQAAAIQGSENHQRIVRCLIDKGLNANALGGRYGSALQAAVYGGNPHMVGLLIEAGAEMNHWDDKGASALFIAARRGDEQVFKLCLKAGADASRRRGSWGSVLDAAVRGGHRAIAERAIEAGANVNEQASGVSGSFPLNIAAVRGDGPMVSLLLEFGARPQHGPGTLWGSNLHDAVFSCSEKTVGLIIGKGGAHLLSLNDPIVGTALSFAIFMNQEAVVALLIQCHANVNIGSGKLVGESPLTLAASTGKLAIAKQLIESGADVNFHGRSSGSTPMAEAAQHGHIEMCFLLRKNGARAPVPDYRSPVELWVDERARDLYKFGYYERDPGSQVRKPSSPIHGNRLRHGDSAIQQNPSPAKVDSNIGISSGTKSASDERHNFRDLGISDITKQYLIRTSSAQSRATYVHVYAETPALSTLNPAAGFCRLLLSGRPPSGVSSGASPVATIPGTYGDILTVFTMLYQ